MTPALLMHGNTALVVAGDESRGKGIICPAPATFPDAISRERERGREIETAVSQREAC